MLGAPHQSRSFDVRTDFAEGARVKVSLVVDGRRVDYRETINIVDGIAGSGSDLCDDDLGGYCPTQSTADILRDVSEKLRSATTLTFIVVSKQKTERLTMHANFDLVLTGIDACIGRPLTKSGRSSP